MDCRHDRQSLAAAGNLSMAVVIVDLRQGLVAKPITRTEITAMTDEMMSLRGLWEESVDAALLREMIGFAACRMMQMEVKEPTGQSWKRHRRYPNAGRSCRDCRRSSEQPPVPTRRDWPAFGFDG
jgi:hypothetical protein